MAIKIFSTGEVLTAADTNEYLANSGLVYITSTTLATAAATITVSNCFSSTYTNYKIILSGFVGSSSGGNVQIQLSASTGSTYFTAGYFMALGTATLNAFGPAATTFWTTGPYHNTRFMETIEIISPQAAQQSFFTAAGVSAASLYQFNGYDSSTAQSTGFTVSNSIGNNFTAGTVTVFGYRKG